MLAFCCTKKAKRAANVGKALWACIATHSISCNPIGSCIEVPKSIGGMPLRFFERRQGPTVATLFRPSSHDLLICPSTFLGPIFGSSSLAMPHSTLRDNYPHGFHPLVVVYVAVAYFRLPETKPWHCAIVEPHYTCRASVPYSHHGL